MNAFPSLPVSMLAAGALLSALAIAAPPSTFTVNVRNGPHAGTYQLPDRGSLCFHSKAHRVYSAAWEGGEVRDAGSIGQAGIEVINPDAAGAKIGSVRISFGDTQNHPTVYEVTAAPVALTVTGRDAEIAFEGKTTAGIGLKVAVSCRGTDEM